VKSCMGVRRVICDHQKISYITPDPADDPADYLKALDDGGSSQS